MRLVILESPYAGDVESNVVYARAAVRDCLRRGEAPMASHLLYAHSGVLDDLDPGERKFGIEAGLAWGAVAIATVVYTDRGISAGMRLGIEDAECRGRLVEYRTIGRSHEKQELVGKPHHEDVRDLDEGGTCDWGNCDRRATCMRYRYDDVGMGAWLNCCSSCREISSL